MPAWQRIERRWWAWFLAALVLVALRCAPSMLFEQFDFDSDQAIVGLMAKHLVDGQHFPLFFYGQHYMLGVQAWIAAPFFLVGGPTIAMLRLPLVVVNVAVVWWLLFHLINRGASAPWAFVATLPLIATGPVASTLLMQTLGASVEPLLYVLVLWFVSDRPAVFGALFCVAYLHRELTLFALPALVIVWLLNRPRLDRASAYGLTAALAFAAVWVGIALLTPRINTLGPPGGDVSPGSLFAQSEMVLARLSFDPAAYVARLAAVIRDVLPNLYALHAEPLSMAGLQGTLTVGSLAGGVALGAGLAIAAWNILFVRRANASVNASEARVTRNAPNAVTVRHQPCEGGTRVAVWCIDDPLQR